MSLFERKGIWYYLFYVNGKRYRGSTEIKVAGAKAKKLAGDIEADARKAVRDGDPAKPKRPPVLRDYLKDFTEWVKSINKSPKTRSDYLNGCRLILATPLSGMRLDQITKGDLEATQFHESPYSTNSALRMLRRALRRAMEKKIVREIPKIALVDAPRRELTVTVQDENRLLRAIEFAATNRRYKKRPPSPLKDVFTLMLDTGMRDGEVVRMKIENIRWAEFCYFIEKGKTKRSRRFVPLSDRAIDLLRARCENRQNGFVFPSAKSPTGHIELSGLQHAFRKIARNLGIPDALKLYCSRHTYGTVTMAETRNPALVQETMGHEDLDTTMGYVHQDVMEAKRVIDRYNQRKLNVATATVTATVQ